MAGRHGLTASEYQKAFDDQVAKGFRLVSVSGYSDTGIARHAAIWHKDLPGEWHARHGLDADGYQRAFDELNQRGFMPVQVERLRRRVLSYMAIVPPRLPGFSPAPWSCAGKAA